jgi:hypothetical protein
MSPLRDVEDRNARYPARPGASVCAEIPLVSDRLEAALSALGYALSDYLDGGAIGSPHGQDLTI